MKNPIKQFIIILLTAILLQGCSKNSTPKTHHMGNKVVVAAGDSLTAGFKLPSDQNYPFFLGQMLGGTVINEGISGDTSEDLLSRFNEILTEHQPNLIILCIGGNDMLRRKSLLELEKNITIMIENAQKRGSKVLLVGVPQPAIFRLKTADLYYSVSEKMNVPIEDSSFETVLSKRMTIDQIHPTAEGYKIIAEDIYHKIIEEELI